jgi:hypothetical protein
MLTDTLNQKYNVTNLTYPLKLDSQEYGSNKVVFFINVSTAGKQAKQIAKDGNSLLEIPQSDLPNFAGTKLLDMVREGYGNLGVGGLVDLVSASTMKRLSTAICLYMPTSVRTKWSVAWEEQSSDQLEKFQNIEANAIKILSAAGAAKAAFEGDGDAAKTAGAELLTVTRTNIIRKALNENAYAQKALKTTSGNSKAEQLFQQVDFREFEFQYFFSPKSEDEAKAVLSIIRKFRYHMLPEFKDPNNFLYIYPSEFNIKYYHGAKENQFIEKIMTAVLTRCDVDYTPNGQFVSFDNGMPQQINLSLTFKELSVTTKETSPEDSVGL